ncbi:sigma factor-like helix-turn-helix DNA-binding protein, partial [Faecalibacterium prausnitzii]|uniref:sigma factor-like helix-turn-helix DNA-binding protein n=1 Tax=Faecalibacterium prausnitzii TaxID=853 RepID=UPI0006DC547C
MGFNYGLEKKNFDSRWAVTRKQYEDAGMSSEAIQAMYDYDWSVFNANRSYQNHTQEMAAPSFEQSEESYSPLMDKYREAISVTDTYHETKSRFAWIGEIEDERLLSALENLSDVDLELITLYAYEGYDTVEISKAFGTTKQNISKKIHRITNFIKNF